MVSVLYLISMTFIYIKFVNFNLNSFKNLIYILLIPLIAIIMLIIHELIHIVLFKLFGKGNTKIKIVYDKEVGAVAIYQSNKDVQYSLYEVLIILLTPLILLTIIGLLILPFISNPAINEALKLNILINILGSHLDFLVSFLLLTKYNNNKKISFDYNSKDGMIIILK